MIEMAEKLTIEELEQISSTACIPCYYACLLIC